MISENFPIMLLLRRKLINIEYIQFNHKLMCTYAHHYANKWCQLFFWIFLYYFSKIHTKAPSSNVRKVLKYEVSSIKNANPSIKFEGIKLQKCVIACKKGINVVVRFQYSEISWDKNSICNRQLKIKKNLTPSKQLDKKCKKVQKFFLINDSKRTTYNYLRRVLKPVLESWQS